MAYIGKSPSGSGVRTRYYFTQSSGGGTSISGTDDNGKTLTYTDGEYVDVYLNGVLLVHGTDYGTGTANTISSLAALSGGDVVEVVVYDIFNVAKINNEAVRKRYYKTASGSETSISGADDSGATITFPANAEIEVKLNGVALVQGTDYNTTSANTVGGLSALSAGQVVEVVVYERFVLGDTVSKADGGTFAGNVGFSGDITVDTNTLHVDSTNNRVGVGTVTPDAPLEIETSGSDFATLKLNAPGNSTAAGYLLRAHDGDFDIRDANNSATRMTIDSSGNVGIGTSTLTDKLNVEGDIRINNAVESPNNLNLEAENGRMSFSTGSGSPSEAMRIKSDGEVNIGGGSDSFTEAHLNVYNNGGTSNGWGGAALTVYGPYGGGLSFVDSGTNPADGDNGYKMHTVDGGNDFYIRGTTSKTASSGGVYLNDFATSWSSASDERQKENIVNITGALDDVATLRAVKANYIWSDTTRAFLIAQDVQAVLPEAVSIQNKEAEEAEQRLGIDYYQVVPLLVAALKEAKTKIETLETKVAALEAAE